MKLCEILKASLIEPLPSADEIIASAYRYQKPKKRCILLIVAAVVLCSISVSAAMALSGFDIAFSSVLDTGKIRIRSVAGGDAEFGIEVTEIWFDKHNIHLGGIVTTAEPLDPIGRYELLAYYRVNDGEEHPTQARIYPSSGCEAAFVLSSWQRQGENGWERVGVTGEAAEITLRFERICDWSRQLVDGHIDDFTTHHGEVSLVLDAVSAESSPLRGSLDGVTATMNECTLELVGDLGQYHTIWVEMHDGTLLGRDPGAISWSSHTQNGLLLTFAKPVDLTRVKAVLLVDEWYTYPSEVGTEEVIRTGITIPLA